MAERDYSQLPVVEAENQLAGMVTTESILRAVRTFQVLPDRLAIRDCQIKPLAYESNDELFDVLKGLEAQASVVVVDRERRVIGILTDYDMATYFRQRAENAMLVEDIEGTLRDFIRLSLPPNDVGDGSFQAAVNAAVAPDRDREMFKSAICTYLTETKGKLPAPEEALDQAFAILSSPNKEKKAFDDLTFAEYTKMWLSSERWHRYANVIKLDRSSIQKMMDNVREVRNKIAHFRGDVTKDEHTSLVQCRDWMSAYQSMLLAEFGETEEVIQEQIDKGNALTENVMQAEDIVEPSGSPSRDPFDDSGEGSFDVDRVSKYSALKRWLAGVPHEVKTTWISFDKASELIGTDLPPSASKYRSWWANERSPRSQSRLWLEASWETDIIDLENKRIRFRRANTTGEEIVAR